MYSWFKNTMSETGNMEILVKLRRFFYFSFFSRPLHPKVVDLKCTMYAWLKNTISETGNIEIPVKLLEVDLG